MRAGADEAEAAVAGEVDHEVRVAVLCLPWPVSIWRGARTGGIRWRWRTGWGEAAARGEIGTGGICSGLVEVRGA